MEEANGFEATENDATAELRPHEEVPPTDADCAAFEVRVNVEELARLRQNYETERFSAICGWKNYNELKAAVEKAGYSAYNPSRMRDENEALKAKVAELEAQVADYGKTPKFTVTRKAYDELEQRANHAELKAAELRRRLGGAATDVGEERDDELKTAKASYAMVCAELIERDRKIKELRDWNERLQKDGRMDTLNAERTNHTHTRWNLEKAQKENQSLHATLDELMGKLALAEQERDAFRKGRDERQKERDKERAKVKALRGQSDALEQALHDCVVLLNEEAQNRHSMALGKTVGDVLHEHEAVIDTVFPF